MMKAIEATNKLEEKLRDWRLVIVAGDYGDYIYDEDKVKEKAVPILEELCRNGADLNYLERERGFALIPRVFWSETLIRLFLDRGMDINSRDENGDTALRLAIRHHSAYTRRKEIKFLVDQLADADPNEVLETLAENKSLVTEDILEILLQRGADETALLHFRNNDNRLIKAFVRDKEKNVDVKTSRWRHYPLMEAATNDNCLEICRQLLEMGADINVRDFQGYTALHHAVLNGAQKCAELLMKMGADPNVKSSSGRDSYDLAISPPYYRSRDWQYLKKPDIKVFTEGATPSKQIAILEIAGALRITKYMNRDDAIELWDRAINICKEFDLQPSQEFLINYEIFKNFDNNFRLRNSQEVDLLPLFVTIGRLSPDEGTIRFWNLLFAFPEECLRFRFTLFDILNNLFSKSESITMKNSVSIEDFASIEDRDFQSLFRVVKFFDEWLRNLVIYGDEYGLKNEVTPERISLLHSVAILVLACLNKVKHATKSDNYLSAYDNHCITLCHALTSLQVQFGDVIMSKTELFDDNKRLLKTLMELSDNNNFSLIHDIVQRHIAVPPCSNFESEFIELLLDFVINVRARNRSGFELVQLINWNMNSAEKQEYLRVFVKLAEMGGHLDARNESWSDPTLREILLDEDIGRSDLTFRNDSLQCACARVLARSSLVPFRNRLPKCMVDFIHDHMR